MKKGFTLIELLAVIIVLAALAAIVVPVTTGITKESKEKTKQASIELYAKATKQAILEYELEKRVSPKSFEDIEPYIEYDGNEVSCEKKILNNDQSIYIDKCSVNGKLVEDYSVGKKICTLVSGTENEIGSKYECEVKPGVKYSFYVLSNESDGTTNLIMERNICSDGTVATAENKCTVAWTSWDYLEEHAPQDDLDNYENLNIYGPVTAMAYLNSATSDWSNIPNLNITYNDEDGMYGSIKLEGKARLPYHREVNTVGCEDGDALTCPVWMVDYLNDSGLDYETTCQQNPINNIYGYWTLSSSAAESYYAWFVEYSGFVNYFSVYNDGFYGVRPVININL